MPTDVIANKAAQFLTSSADVIANEAKQSRVATRMEIASSFTSFIPRNDIKKGDCRVGLSGLSSQ